MKVIGNKICGVCSELNDIKRKRCMKCKCILLTPIREGRVCEARNIYEFKR